MSKEIIAVISEGEKTEKQIVANLEEHFFRSNGKPIEFLAFKTNIYALWEKLKEDDFDTKVIEVLRERDQEIALQLENVDVQSISQIYLFFDYDGHAIKNSNYGDSIIQEMISRFDNETDLGKIYISYPMVEAVKHLTKYGNLFKDLTVRAKENIHYKNLVSTSTDFQNLTQLSVDDWYYISKQNLKKANHILEQSFSTPEYSDYKDLFGQDALFQCQLEKYINASGDVAVLSGFPFFLIDYFGENIFQKINLFSPKVIEV